MLKGAVLLERVNPRAIARALVVAMHGSHPLPLVELLTRVMERALVMLMHGSHHPPQVDMDSVRHQRQCRCLDQVWPRLKAKANCGQWQTPAAVAKTRRKG